MPTEHDGSFFRRFRPKDPDEVRSEIAADRQRLEEAQCKGDGKPEIGILIRIGLGLYITDGETEAVAILTKALNLAKLEGDSSAEIEAMLHLATAYQYAGQCDLAQSLFTAGLEKSQTHGIDDFEHFILHHQGRCWVEQDNPGEARKCFEKALHLREKLGIDRFILSTRTALDELHKH